MEYRINTEALELFMKEHNLSTTKFAKLCGISISAMRKILDNNLDVDMVAIFKLSKYIGIHIAQLVIPV